MVRHEAFADAVQAESNVSVPGRRRDGVGAGNFFSFFIVGLHGDPLAGNETETRLGHFELEMRRSLGEHNRAQHFASVGAKGSHFRSFTSLFI